MPEWETINPEPEQTEPNRDRYGRPLIIPPGGGKPEAYSRCTTYVGVLEDTYNLSKWQQRQVAAGLAQRQDLQLRAASLGLQPDDLDERKRWRRDMDDVAKQSMEAAQASKAATIGTSIHALTERIDLGKPLGTVPAEYRPHLQAYEKATATFEPAHIEQFTVNDELKIGGTPDRVSRIDGNSRLYVMDVKTGTVEFGTQKMAMQLAVYANSLKYNIDTGERDTLGDVDTNWGIIIALSAENGNCDLHWINLEAGWEAVDLATQVREWRKTKVLHHYQQHQPDTDPLPAVNVTNDTNLLKAIRDVETVQQLYDIWRQAEQINRWTPELTNTAAKRKKQLV